jgi:glycosyltransferase involved in cell wall biosynthesis
MLTPPTKLNVLWFIDLDYRYGLKHGGNLRFFNYAKELIARGAQVYFAFNKRADDDEQAKRNFLDELKRNRMLSGHFEFDYKYPRHLSRLSSLMINPALANFVLREFQRPIILETERLIAQREINLCIFSARRFLFVVPHIKCGARVLIDWADSFTLYHLREAAAHLKARAFKKLPTALRYLVENFAQESFYGRRAAANIVVSPVDKRVLDAVNRCASKNRVLLNGTTLPDEAQLRRSNKIPHRLAFTGNMNFPPNYQAALWFIDNVLPLLVRHNPRIKFVVAGANPVEELKMRAGEHVELTGFVEDMNREISQSALYIAPLISGGGFKNKIIEAIANETFVVATPIAVEFLEPRLSELLSVAAAPDEFAEKVLEYLAHPEIFAARLKRAREIVRNEFTWSRRTDELLAIAFESAPAEILTDAKEQTSCA